MSFFMSFGRFFDENAVNCCRVCCKMSSGYYYLSSLLGLLHEAAQVLSYGPQWTAILANNSFSPLPS